IEKRGRFSLALSGGETPRPVYSRLASPQLRQAIDWSRVFIYFGDERCVPPRDTRSNYLMARTVLFDQIPIKQTNIFRIHGEDPPEKAARDYENVLCNAFGVQSSEEGGPREGLDLILLGMGENGHTASLFPGSGAVSETKRWVMAVYVETASMWRITTTPLVINAARQVAFLVSGTAKAEMLSHVIEGPFQPAVLPAQSVRPTRGKLLWMVDRQAAARLRMQT
ncbi:MAG: 6-phosphogluconolactonase, partial [Syntrophobacteraceae bacterium]